MSCASAGVLHRPPFPPRRSSDLLRLHPDRIGSRAARGRPADRAVEVDDAVGGDLADEVDDLDADAGQRVAGTGQAAGERSEEHTSELQSLRHLVCRLLLEKKKKL